MDKTVREGGQVDLGSLGGQGGLKGQVEIREILQDKEFEREREVCSHQRLY